MIVRKNKDTGVATLILNEEELTLLWHKLNCAHGTKFTEYEEQQRIPISSHQILYNMWESINDKFRPPRRRT